MKFNPEEFLQRLGREEFLPGHTKYDIEKEIRNRFSALDGRLDIMERIHQDPSKISGLRAQGIQALLGRFPEEKGLLSKLMKQQGGYENQLEEWKDE